MEDQSVSTMTYLWIVVIFLIPFFVTFAPKSLARSHWSIEQPVNQYSFPGSVSHSEKRRLNESKCGNRPEGLRWLMGGGGGGGCRWGAESAIMGNKLNSL